MRKWLAILLLVLLLSACQSNEQPTPAAPDLVMKPEITMGEGGLILLRLGVHNRGGATFPGTEVFDGVVTIADEEGKVQKEVRLSHMNPVPVGETVFPVEMDTSLTEGTYTFTWATPGYATVSFRFIVADRASGQVLKAPLDYINPYTEYTEVDPTL